MDINPDNGLEHHTRVCNENRGVYLTRLGNCIVEDRLSLPYRGQGLSAGQEDCGIFARSFECSEGLSRKRVRVSGKCKVLVGSFAELSKGNRRWDGSAVAMDDCLVSLRDRPVVVTVGMATSIEVRFCTA